MIKVHPSAARPAALMYVCLHLHVKRKKRQEPKHHEKFVFALNEADFTAGLTVGAESRSTGSFLILFTSTGISI